MIKEILLNDEKIKEYLQAVASEKNISLYGLTAQDKGVFLGLAPSPAVFVCHDFAALNKLHATAESLGKKVAFIANSYQNSMGMVDAFLKFDFLTAVNKLITGEVDLLFVTVEALFQNCPSKNEIESAKFALEVGGSYNFAGLNSQLVKMGYERAEYISHRGQYSVRGDIVEIYPINDVCKFKLDFFDDELEKISKINIEDRKIIEKCEKIELISINYEKESENLLNYAQTVIFDEPKRLEEIAQSFEKSDEYYNAEKLFDCNAKTQIAFQNFASKTFFKQDEIILFEPIIMQNYVYNYVELIKDIKIFLSQKKDVYLACGNKENIRKLKEIFKNNGYFLEKNAKNVVFLENSVPFSLNFKHSGFVLVGTNSLFKEKKLIENKRKAKAFVPSAGEFVVHNVHGVGKCVGVEKMNFQGFEKDYFIIEYAGGDKFYLPSEQADSLSAFLSNDEVPRLNKLGGVEFAKIKNNVYSKVKELAFDLLQLYAKRENSKGTIYKPDDYLMEKFEEAFPYEETPDQLRAITDIKRDMESTRIMDRLVCGDVGFGKTEVALRAIYKAVLSGKQVAFLCPTTILAEQHYKTCLKRFSGFMVKTARYNRLVSASEQKNVLAGLASGEINVVCGTHKLLSSDVIFKDLGLLVLDEEQRFGVEHKEKIKNLKNNIDVLTLSATPIPRTLHMALSGIRDISIIETPPQKRLPVQTFVTEISDELIVRSVTQEIRRGGQAFIIYNRVETIYHFAAHVEKLLPGIRIGIAHGKLSARQLEDIILKLYSGEFDVLIATTLIENGVDLPVANTLIVIDADKLGLSALYQLRGRIGRSDRLAYAYFTYSPEKTLTEQAFKRLNAMVEYSQLGSGFKIAMTDLSIRGAGNVLGKEQHGNLMKVGYDLYYKLLEDALKEIKGEKVIIRRDIKMDINIDAFISEEYIPSETERISKINAVSRIATKEEFGALKEEFEINYGNLPDEVENLMKIAFLKNLAVQFDVKRIFISNAAGKIFFHDSENIVEISPNLPVLDKIRFATEYFLEKIGSN